MDETLTKPIVPIGDFIIANAKGVAGKDGVYYHYSEVCTLLKKYSDQYKPKKPEVVTETTNDCAIYKTKTLCTPFRFQKSEACKYCVSNKLTTHK